VRSFGLDPIEVRMVVVEQPTLPYLAVYSRTYRTAMTILLGCTLIVVASAFLAEADRQPLYAPGAFVAAALMSWQVLQLWQRRVLFANEGIWSHGPLEANRKAYSDLIAVEWHVDRMLLRFADGSSLSINDHMADLTVIRDLLFAQKAVA
jgi:hypothetical protein